MNTLYERLEVSEKASQEIIEKAYRVLAKKYHPDVQEPDKRAAAEEQMKQINEAYEILSDENKRKQYDQETAQQRQQEKAREEEKRRVIRPQANQGQPSVQQNQQAPMNTNPQQQERKYTPEEIKQAQKNYVHAYKIQLRKLKAEWTLKKLRDFLLAIGIMIGIFAFLWFFPPTHRFIISFYENNIVLQSIGNTMMNMIHANQ